MHIQHMRDRANKFLSVKTLSASGSLLVHVPSLEQWTKAIMWKPAWPLTHGRDSKEKYKGEN